MRVTRPLWDPTGCVPACARRPCGWAVRWPRWCRTIRRFMAFRRCWNFRPHAPAPVQVPTGEAVLLEEQDRSRWDQLLIRRGLAALSRAEGLGEPIGFYTVQAAIAACHAQARIPEDTDWRRIASLYDLLAELAPNPVVEVNRALAHGRAYGPDAGLTILAQLDNDSTLSG